MKYSAEEFSRAGDQFLGRSYEEMDCQALVERMMAAVGYRRDLGGSNSWYRECRSNGWTGTPEECVKEFGSVPKGALLFIREDVSASTPGKFRSDGNGDITHMGVKTGRGDGAIHSSHSRGCVCTSKFRDRTIPNGGWNRVGLLNVFSYGKTVDWVLEHGGGGTRRRTERGDCFRSSMNVERGDCPRRSEQEGGDTYERYGDREERQHGEAAAETRYGLYDLLEYSGGDGDGDRRSAGELVEVYLRRADRMDEE